MLNNGASNNTLLLLARILLAIIFIWAGYGKLMSLTGTAGYFTSLGIPAASIVAPLTGLVELIGGLLILVGFQTRYAALVLAIFTIAAALVAHLNFGDRGQTIHLTKNLAIAGGFLALIAAGAGSYSMDARKG